MKNLNTKKTAAMDGDVAADACAVDETHANIEGLKMTLSQLSDRLRALRAAVESARASIASKPKEPDNPMKSMTLFQTGPLDSVSPQKWNNRIFGA